jgi:DNA-binding NtrC family response regulator
MGISVWPQGRCGQDTALLVNSQQQQRKAIEHFLSNADYHVLCADTSEQAVELCRSYRGAIHLLVTDLELGGASGWDLAETAARMRPGLVVLFLSNEAPAVRERKIAPEVLLQFTHALGIKARQRQASALRKFAHVPASAERLN